MTRATALLHVSELIVYAALLALLVRWQGLEGAAIAWTLRSIFDLAAMSWLLHSGEQRRQLALAA